MLKRNNMQKSTIGTPPIAAMQLPSQNQVRASAAITNLTNLINTGKFDANSTAKLQSKLSTALALQSKLSRPTYTQKSVISGAIGDDGDDGDDDDDDDDDDDTTTTTTNTTTTTSDPGILADIEGAVSSAAAAYATVTKNPPPVTIVKGSQTVLPADNSTNLSILGLPAPVIGIGAVALAGLIIWGIMD